MSKAEQYLETLKHEKELWQKKVDELPSESIKANNPYYKMANVAAARYSAASYMMKLMKEEVETA